MVNDPTSFPGEGHLPFRLEGDPSRVFRRPSNSGLWLPDGTGRQAPTTGMAFFSRTFVSFSDVYGREPTWSDAVENLQRYDLATILNTIGCLSSAIHNLSGDELVGVQAGLIRWLFEDRSAEVEGAAIRMLQDIEEAEVRTPAPVVVFHELQLVNAAKLALLEVDYNREIEAETPDDLGDALLMVNDLIGTHGETNELPSDPNTEEERQEWERFFIVNGYFHHQSSPAPDLVRCWDLYLTDRPHLRDSAVYQNLPRIAEDVTGLSPIQLWARLFAAYGHWGKGPNPSSGALPEPLNLETHFTENFSFEPQEEQAFWSLVAAAPEELRGEFTEHERAERELAPYDILPLEKRPLVRIGNQILCPSALLMLRRMTKGLHYIFLNHLSDPDRRDDYLNYMGQVYEDYVFGLLDEQFGGMVGRLIREDELEEAAPDGAQVCDGVIVYPDGALLLEVKAKRLPLGARIKGDLDVLDDVFRDVFVDAAGQLDSVIRLIESGSLSGLGLLPSRMKRYVPVSVSLDPIPMNPFTYDRLDRELEANDYLQQDQSLPLQLLSAEDVEIFELAGSHGRNVMDMLVDRILSGGHRFAGLLNHLAINGDSLVEMPHTRLKDRFEDLTNQALAVFEERKRETAQDG